MELIYMVMYDRALKRRIRDRLDPLALSDQELIRHYRFPRCELIRLIEELEPFLQRRTRRSHAIPTRTQVLMALRIYASGSFQHVIGDVSGMWFSWIILTIRPHHPPRLWQQIPFCGFLISCLCRNALRFYYCNSDCASKMYLYYA